MLIGAFVLPECTRFKAKLIEAKEARDAEYLAKKAEREKFFAECDAQRAEYEKQCKELDKAVDNTIKLNLNFLLGITLFLLNTRQFLTAIWKRNKYATTKSTALTQTAALAISTPKETTG